MLRSVRFTLYRAEKTALLIHFNGRVFNATRASTTGGSIKGCNFVQRKSWVRFSIFCNVASSSKALANRVRAYVEVITSQSCTILSEHYEPQFCILNLLKCPSNTICLNKASLIRTHTYPSHRLYPLSHYPSLANSLV